MEHVDENRERVDASQYCRMCGIMSLNGRGGLRSVHSGFCIKVGCNGK